MADYLFDEGKNKIVGSPKTRIDSIDTELQNVRIGADGTLYPSAGEAVRSQFENSNNSINKLMGWSTIETDPVGFSVGYTDSVLYNDGYVISSPATQGYSVSSAVSIPSNFRFLKSPYQIDEFPSEGWVSINFYSDSGLSTFIESKRLSNKNEYVGIPTNAKYVRFTIPQNETSLSCVFANIKLYSDTSLMETGCFPDSKVVGDYIYPMNQKINQIYDLTKKTISGTEIIIYDSVAGKAVSCSGLSSGATLYNAGANLVTSQTYTTASARYSGIIRGSASDLVIGETYTISAKVTAAGPNKVAFDTACGLFGTGASFDIPEGSSRITYTFVAIATSCSNKTILSITGTTGNSITPAEIMIQKGMNATPYEPHRLPLEFTNPAELELLTTVNNIYSSANDNLTVVYYSNYEPALKELIIEQLPKPSKGFMKVSGDLETGESLTIPRTNAKNNQNYTFMAKVNSLTELLIGHGKTTYEAAYIKITPTNADFCRYTTSLATTEHVHGLTISGFLYVNIQVKERGNATITIQTLEDANQNYEFSFETTGWTGDGDADYFVDCVGGSFEDCVFTWSCADFKKDLWAFGDSYFACTSTRWPYYMNENGYYSVPLWNGYAGENSEHAIVALKNMIRNFGKPKFILWCLGMNDGSDTQTTPNATWLLYIKQVLNICAENQITPILCTIPTVSNNGNLKNNEGKNQWIRSSGYRYVDAAFAVGANSSGQWYEGMLSSDEQHPDVQGGKALYKQFITDCPELTYINNGGL